MPQYCCHSVKILQFSSLQTHMLEKRTCELRPDKRKAWLPSRKCTPEFQAASLSDKSSYSREVCTSSSSSSGSRDLASSANIPKCHS